MSFFKMSFFIGFFAKLISGFDDTAVHTPLIARFTKTRAGKLAFIIGMFLALLVILLLADILSELLALFPYRHLVSALFLFLLAFVIYFDIFVHVPRKKAEDKVQKLKGISAKKFGTLLLTGFLAFFATAIDDAIVLSSVIKGDLLTKAFIVAGVLCAALLELGVIFFFSKIFLNGNINQKLLQLDF